jgi:hypothetical protein
MEIGGGNGEPHYPCLYIDTDEPIDFPESGTARIKFTRVKVSEESRKGKPTKYCYELSVEAVGDIEKGKRKKEKDDTASVVDRLLVAVLKDSDGGEVEY